MNNAIVISDKYIMTQYNDLKSKVVDVTVTDDTCFEVTDYTGKIRKLIKFVKEKKVESVVSLKEQIAQTEEPFNAMIKELNDLDALLSKKLLAYQQEKREQERKRLEEAKAEEIRLLNEAKKATRDKESKANLKVAIENAKQEEVKPVSVIKSFGTTSSVKENVKYEITDPDKVPREFCSPDPGKLWPVIRGLNTQAKIDTNKIPGIRVWLQEGLNLRQR